MCCFTTVEANPDKAAEFLRSLKAKKKDKPSNDEADWFEISASEVQEKLARQSLWENSSPTARGRDYEKLREVNLGSNFKVVDDIHVYEKIATSMKSLNTTDATYKGNPSTIESLGKSYVDKFEDFSGVTYPDGFHIGRKEFDHFNLEIAVPAGKLSQGERDALHRVREYGQHKGVRVIIAEVA